MHSPNSLRERLVDVGVDLVMAEGAASLGLREIARRAGVSHGAPRRHFPTHHALLSAIAHRGFTDLAARFAAQTDDGEPPRAQLAALGQAYVRYAVEHRGMFELMFRHELLDSERHGNGEDTSGEATPRLRESTLPLFAHLVDLVARHEATRDRTAAGRGTPPATTAAALWAQLHGIAQLWVWGSLPLVLSSLSPGDGAAGGRPEALVEAALDAHLGPAEDQAP